MRKIVSLITLVIFVCTSLVPPSVAQEVFLPAAQKMITLTPDFSPCFLRGIKVDPKAPLRFDFIVDEGDTHLDAQAFEDEAERLIKYFLATLTTPEKDIWVNLSPYENDRIIQDDFGRTAMGRDLLAQDYILKQLTASLMHPDSDLGRRFWEGVYQKAQEKYGTTDIPVDSFNKVWIVPEHADVYEQKNADGTMAAFVDQAKLRVMLETDYLAQERAVEQQGNRATFEAVAPKGDSQELAKEVVRSVILPALEHEVNHGSNFAPLRQVYHSLLLAAWLKKKLQTIVIRGDQGQKYKGNILSLIFLDQRKTGGIETDDPQAEIDNIYERYVDAFKTGAYNLIREDYDFYSQEVIPRKYFSGGFTADGYVQKAMVTRDAREFSGKENRQFAMVTADLAPAANGAEAPGILPVDGARRSRVLAMKDTVWVGWKRSDRVVSRADRQRTIAPRQGPREIDNVRDLQIHWDADPKTGAPNGFVLERSIAHRLAGLNADLRSSGLGYYLSVRDGIRTLRYQERRIANWLAEQVSLTYGYITDDQRAALSGMLIKQDETLRFNPNVRKRYEDSLKKDKQPVLREIFGAELTAASLMLAPDDQSNFLNNACQWLEKSFNGFADPELTAPHLASAVDIEVHDAKGKSLATKVDRILKEFPVVEQPDGKKVPEPRYFQVQEISPSFFVGPGIDADASRVLYSRLIENGSLKTIPVDPAKEPKARLNKSLDIVMNGVRESVSPEALGTVAEVFQLALIRETVAMAKQGRLGWVEAFFARNPRAPPTFGTKLDDLCARTYHALLEVLQNRRLFVNLMTLDVDHGGLLPVGQTFSENPNEFWHFDPKGSRSDAVRTGAVPVVDAFLDINILEIIWGKSIYEFPEIDKRVRDVDPGKSEVPRDAVEGLYQYFVQETHFDPAFFYPGAEGDIKEYITKAYVILGDPGVRPEAFLGATRDDGKVNEGDMEVRTADSNSAMKLSPMGLVNMIERWRVQLLQRAESRWWQVEESVRPIDDLQIAVERGAVVPLKIEEVFSGPLRASFRDGSVAPYVHPDVVPRLKEFYKRTIQALHQLGVSDEEMREMPPLFITSTVRDLKEQQRLIEEGKPAVDGTKSAHLRGLAVDFHYRDYFDMLKGRQRNYLSNLDPQRRVFLLKTLIRVRSLVVGQMENEGKIHYISENRNSPLDIFFGLKWRPTLHFAVVPSIVLKGEKAMQARPDAAKLAMKQESFGVPATADYGGIDLNTNRLDMLIKGNAGNFDIELTPEQLRMLQQDVSGFVPVIIGVTPLESVPGFLGMMDVAGAVSG